MRLIPQERFIIVEPVKEESQSGYIYQGTSTFELWTVMSLGKDVDDTYVKPGDIVACERSEVNIVKIKNETHYMVSIGQCVKVEE